MEDRSKFQKRIIFRMFGNEYDMLNKIFIHSKTPEGWRKYESISHLIRCAVMGFINNEMEKINIKPGRPKKYGVEDDKANVT